MGSFGSVVKESHPRDRVPNLDHRRHMVTRVVFDAIPQVVIVAMEEHTCSMRRLALQIGCLSTRKAHHYGIYVKKKCRMSLLRILTRRKLRIG